jgi:signal transduction histidine kinase
MNTKRLFLAYFFLASVWAIFSEISMPFMADHHYRSVHLYQTVANFLFMVSSVGVVYLLMHRDVANRQRLTAQILQAQDLERKRISRELHDDLGQLLIALKLNLSRIFAGAQDQTLDDVKEIIEKVRNISWNLSPSTLDDVGLPATLNNLFARLNNQVTVRTANLDEITNCFSPESRLSIFRVFQEIMTNILKHAGASMVDIAVERKRDQVLFTVQDDGHGFDPKEISPGVGLASLRERIASLKGECQIITQRGRGTKIIFQIPSEDQAVSH